MVAPEYDVTVAFRPIAHATRESPAPGYVPAFFISAQSPQNVINDFVDVDIRVFSPDGEGTGVSSKSSETNPCKAWPPNPIK
jgi:hypothetical protein